MIDIAFIVEDIVNAMDCNVTVLSNNGNDLTVCNVKWASVDKVVTDLSGNTYKVTTVDHSTKVITILPLGAYLFSGELIILTRPKYFTGTPMATNIEWGNFARNDERAKTPFIWLVEPTQERTFEGLNTSIERESDIRVEFLDHNKVKDWLTLDTHKYKLQSLYNMREWFIKAANNMSFMHEITGSSARNLTKFGNETDRGFDKNIIDANLTGVDSRHTLSIYKTDGCNC